MIYEAFGSPTITLDGVTIRNTMQPAIMMFAPSGSVALRNGTVIDNAGARGGDCGAVFLSGANSSFSMDHSTISNSPGVGICVNTQVATER